MVRRVHDGMILKGLGQDQAYFDPAYATHRVLENRNPVVVTLISPDHVAFVSDTHLCNTIKMSRPPPSSAYPTIGRGTPQIPPFPQLLHLKDEALPYRQSSVSEEYHSDDEIESVGSPGAANGGNTSKRDGKGDRDKSTPVDKDRKPHATRRRVVQSCSECRRRKIKCDKK